MYFFFLIFHYYTITLILDHTFLTLSGDIYLSLGISLWCSFLTVSELFRCEVFCIFISAILLPIKPPVASAVLLNYSFWISFRFICCRLFNMIKKVLALFTTTFLLIFLPLFLPMFLAKYKIHSLLQIFNL